MEPARLFLLSVLLWATASFANDRELRKYLDRAVRDSENPAAFTFMSAVPEAGYELLSRQTFRFGMRNWNEIRQQKFRAVYVGASRVVGALGEMYLDHYMGEWIKQSPESRFIDSPSYDRRNVDGTRPDGLVVRLDGDSVIVEKILESKMGPAEYRPDQTYGFGRVWQTIGLTLPDGTHFAPEKIKIGAGRTPILDLDLKQPDGMATMERAMMLFASEPKNGFAGEVVRTPFSSAQLESLSHRFAAYGWLGDKAKPAHVTELLGRQAPLPRYRPRRKAFREPYIRAAKDRELAERLPEKAPPVRNDANDNALVHYIQENLRFPSSDAPELAAYMRSSFGGQMAVFVDLLDDETRSRLADAGRGPAIGPMENWLRRADPKEDGDLVRSISEIYTRIYKRPPPTGDCRFDRLKPN